MSLILSAIFIGMVLIVMAVVLGMVYSQTDCKGDSADECQAAKRPFGLVFFLIENAFPTTLVVGVIAAGVFFAKRYTS